LSDRRRPDALQPRIEYETPTETFVCSPASVISPGVSGIESKAASSGTTSSRSGRPGSAAREHGVEHLGRHRHEIRVGDPRAVESRLDDFRSLSSALRERDRGFTPVSFREGEYAAMPPIACAPAPVARAHDVARLYCAHNGTAIGHLHAIREHQSRARNLLITLKMNSPSDARVERRSRSCALVQISSISETRRDRLDQHGAAIEPTRTPSSSSRAQTPAPTTGALECDSSFGSRSTARCTPLRSTFARVVEEREPEVEESDADNRFTVDREVPFDRCQPAAR